MIAYRYNEQNIYIGQEEAFIDPLESKKAGKDIYVLPADCTFVAPLADQAGYVQKWNGTAWEYVENHIGKTGYVNGEPFEIREYGPLPTGWSDTPPAPTDAEVASNVRAERNAKLTETDYLMLTDSVLTTEQNAAFVEYRQALRDVTTQAGFPNDVVWPTKPEI